MIHPVSLCSLPQKRIRANQTYSGTHLEGNPLFSGLRSYSYSLFTTKWRLTEHWAFFPASLYFHFMQLVKQMDFFYICCMTVLHYPPSDPFFFSASKVWMHLLQANFHVQFWFRQNPKFNTSYDGLAQHLWQLWLPTNQPSRTATDGVLRASTKWMSVRQTALLGTFSPTANLNHVIIFALLRVIEL